MPWAGILAGSQLPKAHFNLCIYLQDINHVYLYFLEFSFSNNKICKYANNIMSKVRLTPKKSNVTQCIFNSLMSVQTIYELWKEHLNICLYSVNE